MRLLSAMKQSAWAVRQGLVGISEFRTRDHMMTNMHRLDLLCCYASHEHALLAQVLLTTEVCT